jgi:hypothetical protein
LASKRLKQSEAQQFCESLGGGSSLLSEQEWLDVKNAAKMGGVYNRNSIPELGVLARRGYDINTDGPYGDQDIGHWSSTRSPKCFPGSYRIFMGFIGEIMNGDEVDQKFVRCRIRANLE